MAEPEVAVVTAAAMEAEAPAAAAMEAEAPAAAGLKREGEEVGDPAVEGGEAAAAKKPRVEGDAKEEKDREEGKAVKLGPKEFASAVEMFDYFFALLHSWAPQLDFNKYEHMVLEDLVKKGHAEPSKKIGPGVEAFEIRNHPVWQSRCFFVRRVDGSSDDFSFRKCVDNILPLPEDMKIGNGKKSSGHHKGGGGRGGGRGGWRGGGRGGRGRGRRGG
ncbi:protein EMBRYO DEFECTIVE 514-like [Phragmites australis]|uniref:protein EMBRYO DEFECTIVE 514-like n=1 Tax=Phragmites australis TaxID=29695 RepID=UPI002D78ABE9|nr:protein EMBRYO DEFECTIVE 514-like [Phragmites australis]